MQNNGQSMGNISVFPALVRSLWKSFSWCLILKVTSDLILLATPKIMKQIIICVESSDPNRLLHGCLLSALLFISSEIQSIMANKYTEKLEILCLQIKSTLLNIVYDKTLKLSSDASISVGKIITIMSVDIQSFSLCPKNTILIFSSFLKVAISTYSIYIELQEASFVGLSAFAVMIPLNLMFGILCRRLQKIQMAIKDQRVHETKNLLSGIEVLKFYAWEEPLMKLVLNTRAKEVSALKKIILVIVLMAMPSILVPILFTLLAFAYFVLVLGNDLTPEKAFVTVSYTNILSTPLLQLSKNFADLLQCSISMQRINQLMNSGEVNTYPEVYSVDTDEEVSVAIENGTFNWTKDGQTVLHSINLKILKGSLTLVVGPIGSGKSSLLSAILGDLYLEKGSLKRCRNIAYVPQQSWIYNASLKRNISLRCSNQVVYETALSACLLNQDIAQLPMGDQTWMGEGGNNLSGGQKQRLSLARAVCQDAQLYLLDSPFSSLDNNVGQDIFDGVLGPKGILKSKTRIVVTSCLKFASFADQVITMKDGYIQDISANCKPSIDETSCITKSNKGKNEYYPTMLELPQVLLPEKRDMDKHTVWTVYFIDS